MIAVAANLGIATCVLRYKEMRTPTNLCLVNLAAADLLFALGVPAVAYTRLTQSWRLGDAVCRLLPYSQVRLMIYFIFVIHNPAGSKKIEKDRIWEIGKDRTFLSSQPIMLHPQNTIFFYRHTYTYVW